MSGLIICSECGGVYRRITRNIKGNRNVVWRCNNRVEYGKQICKGSLTITDQKIKEYLKQKLKVTEHEDQIIRKRVKFIIVDSEGQISVKYKNPYKDISL